MYHNVHVYSETHLKTTDDIDLVSLQLGMGTEASGEYFPVLTGEISCILSKLRLISLVETLMLPLIYKCLSMFSIPSMLRKRIQLYINSENLVNYL